jgi:hypothetical protein
MSLDGKPLLVLLTPGRAGSNGVESFGRDLNGLGGSIEKKAGRWIDSSVL